MNATRERVDQGRGVVPGRDMTQDPFPLGWETLAADGRHDPQEEYTERGTN
ncbi:MAG: hypothetical protein NT069_29485 [Planctomycetota bacterium]|nr:hypothetical protein [Planctomycetota bacterium]